jgi:hypothetical protein
MPGNKRKDMPKHIRALLTPLASCLLQTRRAGHVWPGNALRSLESHPGFMQERACSRDRHDPQNGCN